MSLDTIETAGRAAKSSTANATPERVALTTMAAERVAELLAQRAGLLPVWVRSPKGGPEHYTGFSRSKLYELVGKGLIRSVSIREPGRVTGTRVFELASILRYIESVAAENSEAAK